MLASLDVFPSVRPTLSHPLFWQSPGGKGARAVQYYPAVVVLLDLTDWLCWACRMFSNVFAHKCKSVVGRAVLSSFSTPPTDFVHVLFDALKMFQG